MLKFSNKLFVVVKLLMEPLAHSFIKQGLSRVIINPKK